MTKTRPEPLWRFLGEPEIPGPDGNIAAGLGRKHVALLAYLTLHPGGISRDEAASLLWPESTPDRAKHSLRQCLVDLRKAFGDEMEGLLEVSEQRLALNGSQVAVDTALLENLATREAPPAADLLDLCRGPFLQGFTTRARPFDDWAAAQRARLNGLAVQALSAALARAEEAGDRAEATRLSAVLVELHPGTALVKAPETLPARLARGGAPRRRWRRSTLALGGAAVLAGAILAYVLIPPSPPPSIAVLPFEPLSASRETAELAAGLTTNVTQALYGVSAEDLLVVTGAAGDPELYRKPVTEIAKQLGVTYLMRGEVRVEGGRAEVKVLTLDGKTGKIEDSDNVVGQTKEISRLEDELTLQIIQRLGIELSTAERNRIALINDTSSLEAWIHATKGLSSLIKVTKEDVDDAEVHYTRALEIDPTYVGARRGLAWCWLLRARLGWRPFPEAIERTRRELSQLPEERRDDPTILSLRGVLDLVSGDHDSAVTDGERAVAGLPNSADVHAVYAHTLTFVGRYDEALHEIGEAMKRSPMSPLWYHWVKGRALRMSGRAEEAIAELQRGLDPARPAIAQLVELTAAYAAAGRLEDARPIASLIRRTPFTVSYWQQISPIRDEEPRERERQLLLDAGLPE